jgi:hypothetical protein
MNGRYFLSALGKIVYQAHTMISKALNYYWKIMTIESIQASAVGLSKEELSKIIDTLIDDIESRIYYKSLLQFRK